MELSVGGSPAYDNDGLAAEARIEVAAKLTLTKLLLIWCFDKHCF